MGTCELCGRQHVILTRHHLIPRTRHANKRNRKLFERSEVVTRIAMLCQACHKQAHRTLTEKQMEQQYNTVDELRSHPALQKFISWIASKPAGFKPHG